jgi:hypothetical protein
MPRGVEEITFFRLLIEESANSSSSSVSPERWKKSHGQYLSLHSYLINILRRRSQGVTG